MVIYYLETEDIISSSSIILLLSLRPSNVKVLIDDSPRIYLQDRIFGKWMSITLSFIYLFFFLYFTFLYPIVVFLLYSILKVFAFNPFRLKQLQFGMLSTINDEHRMVIKIIKKIVVIIILMENQRLNHRFDIYLVFNFVFSYS